MIGKTLIFLIRGYQLGVSPLLAGSCRFWPSCSEYARLAIEEHGWLTGSWLAIHRVGRCHPWNPGGVDMPPRRRA